MPQIPRPITNSLKEREKKEEGIKVMILKPRLYNVVPDMK
jgi:hypothetical protein